MAMTVLSVSQLARYAKSLLDVDSRLKEVYVRGEITNLSDHYTSGHIYFTLKDETSSIRTVCFRSHAMHLRFRPQNGISVIARGNATIYDKDGTLQLYIYELLPDGAGAFGLAFEQLKSKLFEQGIFDPERKKTLPKFIKTVGIVTSPTGAALKDILSVFQRRSIGLSVKLSPTIVQGKDAAPVIAFALSLIEKENCDLIILCRGGGSTEDLWVFNDETLVRTISNCTTPIISAVGHEIDFTLCDLAADIRAATPTAAAEITADIIDKNRLDCEQYKASLMIAMKHSVALEEQKLQTFRFHPLLQQPNAIIDKNLQRLYNYKDQLHNLAKTKLETMAETTKAKIDLLDSLSPLKVLKRGYSITQYNNHIVLSVKDVFTGQNITTKLANGMIQSIVTEITEDE
jgi:exodeoxyribonuclease VII large subunit